MSLQDNKYVEAIKADVDSLKAQWNEMRLAMKLKQATGDTFNSEVAETAWNDFETHAANLREAGDNASEDARKAYEEARKKVRGFLRS